MKKCVDALIKGAVSDSEAIHEYSKYFLTVR